MKLKYRSLSYPTPFSKRQKLLRPIIPLSLSNTKVSLRFEALIDSGADFCIFPRSIAEKLSINLTGRKAIYFSSATGEAVGGNISNIYLDFGEGSFKTKVVFANLPGNVGILGQYGFFDKFIVKFDLSKKEIEVKQRR